MPPPQVTIWRTLARLGYEWVMRMDDDSFVLSPVTYNVFDDMRARGLAYGYRTISRECPTIFGDFVEGFAAHAGAEIVARRRRRLGGRGVGQRRRLGEQPAPPEALDAAARHVVAFCGTWPRHCRGPAIRARLEEALKTATSLGLDASDVAAAAHGVDGSIVRSAVAKNDKETRPPGWYCAGPGELGYYNNWFVTDVRWRPAGVDDPNLLRRLRGCISATATASGRRSARAGGSRNRASRG